MGEEKTGGKGIERGGARVYFHVREQRSGGGRGTLESLVVVPPVPGSHYSYCSRRIDMHTYIKSSDEITHEREREMRCMG